MMWNWLASVLASDATLVAYDGSPAHPDPHHAVRPHRRARHHAVRHLGPLPRRAAQGRRAPGRRPRRSRACARSTSTGSPLLPEGFDYVYDAVKADVHLASISGGTDLCGCLVGGDPTGPVWAGEIQRPSPGLAIDVVGPDGAPLGPGERGELVCRNPFPSIPLGLWADPDDARFRATYFDPLPRLLAPGRLRGVDRARRRGDPRPVRRHAQPRGRAHRHRRDHPPGREACDGIADCLVIGQEWEGDTRVVLLRRDGARPRR